MLQLYILKYETLINMPYGKSIVEQFGKRALTVGDKSLIIFATQTEENLTN